MSFARLANSWSRSDLGTDPMATSRHVFLAGVGAQGQGQARVRLLGIVCHLLARGMTNNDESVRTTWSSHLAACEQAVEASATRSPRPCLAPALLARMPPRNLS
jgi:hypothetical protein